MFPTGHSYSAPAAPPAPPAFPTLPARPAPEFPPEAGPAPGHADRRALVHLGQRRWVLEPGQSVSFGRGSPCDIRIAHDPLDDQVSRRAGVLECRGEDVVVRNESATRTLIFRPARGSDRIIRPGEAITCLPHREFLVALSGRGGSHYVLQVTAGLTHT